MMRRLLAALALALLLPAASGAAAPAPTPAHVEFAAPAQATGSLQADGLQWALLVFRDAQPDAFALDLAAGGTVTNHTALRLQAVYQWTPGSPQPLPGPVHGRLTLQPHSWSSLYVEADHLHLRPAAYGRVGAAHGEAADTLLPDQPRPATAYRPRSPSPATGNGVWLALDGVAGAPVPFSLAAEGLRRIEWHNATLDCPAAPCPTGAAGWEAGAPLGVVATTELAGLGGTLTGNGTAFIAAAGGGALDLAVVGALRLPEATLQGVCGDAACPDPAGRTLRADGNVSLLGLAPASPGRLHAQMSGAFGARFDESRAFSFGLAEGAAAGAVLLALLFLAKAAVALFSRSARPPALEHPRRRALYDLVRAEPGQSYREIQRALGWPNGTLTNHLARLSEAGLLRTRPHRNTVRYFDGAARGGDAGWEAAVLLREPNLALLQGWLRDHPGSSQGDVVAHAGAAWGWRRSTTQDRLRLLVDGGVLARSREGRTLRYRPTP
jgi:DNA-binding transcriptional ArsR family regulator